LLFVFGFEGTYLTTRDAGKINFWVVHVVAQVASNWVCGSVSSHSVMAHAWWHGSVRIGPAKTGSPSTQKPLRKDTSAWCGYPCQDQKWTYKGTSSFYQINFNFSFWLNERGISVYKSRCIFSFSFTHLFTWSRQILDFWSHNHGLN